jgi:hypothetical protein
LTLDVQAAPVEHIREPERRPAEPACHGIDHLREPCQRRVRTPEVIDDRDDAARPAHALRLGHHAFRVWHHAHHVEGRDVIEAVVGETQVQCIALLERDVAPGVPVHLVLRALEHVRGEVDARHVAVRGIRVEREPRPHAELQDPRPGLDLEGADDHRDARVEDAMEEDVVEVRELVVEPALVGLCVR